MLYACTVSRAKLLPASIYVLVYQQLHKLMQCKLAGHTYHVLLPSSCVSHVRMQDKGGPSHTKLV